MFDPSDTFDVQTHADDAKVPDEALQTQKNATGAKTSCCREPARRVRVERKCSLFKPALNSYTSGFFGLYALIDLHVKVSCEN